MLSLILERGAQWAWGLFAVAVLLRLAAAIVTGGFVLRDRSVLQLFWLIPLRDLLVPFVWMAGLIGRQVVWRGKVFELEHGKLISRD